ncbi:MAG: hypothetical protein MI808_22035 [Pseudomonadales bacterium]|nr:hypothetical protein [Pseudomonadales bacterium]
MKNCLNKLVARLRPLQLSLEVLTNMKRLGSELADSENDLTEKQLALLFAIAETQQRLNESRKLQKQFDGDPDMWLKFATKSQQDSSLLRALLKDVIAISPQAKKPVDNAMDDWVGIV